MPKRLLRNASFNTASQFVYMAVSILFIPAYIGYLGVEGFGIYSFLMLVFTWITMLQAGIDPAVIRMTAKCASEDRHGDIGPLVTASLIFQIAIAGLIGIFFLLSGDYLANFIVKDKTDFLIETRKAIDYAAINIVVLMCKNVYVSLFNGLQRYDVSGIYESLFNIVVSVISLGALWLGYGIVGMLVSRLVLNMAGLLMLHFIAKRLVPSFHLSMNISKGLIKEIYNYASWLVVARINRLAINTLPPVLMNMYVGPAGIAYYSISSRIVLTLNNLLSSSINVIFPFISELSAQQKTEKIRSLYLSANKLLSLISVPLYCFGAIYSWSILYVWLGSDIADNCWMLMSLFFVGYYLTSATMIPTNFSLGIGKTKIQAVTGFAQVIIVIASLPYLLETFGIVGVGINLVLFESPSVVMGIIITRSLVKASVFTFWIKDRIVILLVGILAYSVFFIVWNQFVQVPLGRVGTAVYLCSVFLSGLVIYWVIAQQTNIIDQKTNDLISKLFKRNRSV